MKLVSFDIIRTLDFKDTKHIKPDHYFKEKQVILDADWILYPQYWQVNSLYYSLKKNIFPNINSYHLGHDKIEMTRALMSTFPNHVPYTEILSNTEANREYVLEQFDYPFIAKEIKSSMGNGVHLIENRSQFKQYCEDNEILYIQEKLNIDRDMRITYVGDRVIGAYWRIASENNFKNNVAQGGTISYDDIPEKAISLVETVAKTLGINHAGFDVAEVDGHYYFFEFNVLFGTKGIKDSGIKLNEIILDYLERQTPYSPSPINPNTPFPIVS